MSSKYNIIWNHVLWKAILRLVVFKHISDLANSACHPIRSSIWNYLFWKYNFKSPQNSYKFYNCCIFGVVHKQRYTHMYHKVGGLVFQVSCILVIPNEIHSTHLPGIYMIIQHHMQRVVCPTVYNKMKGIAIMHSTEGPLDWKKHPWFKR